MSAERGLLLGRFIPPHTGHLALIDFASKKCDDLTVAVCSRPEDEIPGKQRYKWMRYLLSEYTNITVSQIKANLPVDKEYGYRASIYWADYCSKRFGKIDVVFSSEKYGPIMAGYMGAVSCNFDAKRGMISISGTLIRGNPWKYRDYIPDIEKPYFEKRNWMPLDKP